MSAKAVQPPSMLPSLWRATPSPAGFGTAVALCGLLMLATTWAVLAGDWVEGAGGTLLVSLTGVAEAALLARALAPRTVAVLAAPPLAFAAVMPFTIGALPNDGDTSFLHLIARYAVAMFPRSIFATDDWTFIVALSSVLWACAYFTTWMVARERSGGWAVFPCFFVLAINVLNAPHGRQLALPDITTGAIAVIIIAQANLSRLAATWRERRVALLPGVISRYIRTSAMLIVLALLVAAFAPAVSSHDFTAPILQSMRGQGIGGGSHGTGTAVVVAPIGFSADTIPGGSLSSAHPQDVLRYTTTAPSPVYIALATDSRFDNGAWIYGGGAGVNDSGATIPWAADAADLGSATEQVSLTVTALVPGATDSLVGNQTAGLAPWIGEPRTISASAQAVGTLTSQNGAEALTVLDHLELGSTLQSGQSVTVTGDLPTATAEQLRSAGESYPDLITSIYLQMPDNSQVATLRSIASSWVNGTDNPYDAAMAIQSRLRGAPFTYTLTPPAAPDGTWPIIDFLTRTHQGYCQYFASSMAALLRADGIPSRVVNGYANGLYFGTDAQGNNIWTISSNDAHSWVQAYFPRYGWISFEPTPPSSIGDYQPLPRGPQALPSPGVTPSPGGTPRPHPTHTPAPEGGAVPPVSPGPMQGPPAALMQASVTTLIVLVVLLLGAVWLARPRDLASLWRRIGLIGRLFGVRRRGSDTDAGYAARIIAAIPPDSTTLLHPHGDGSVGPRPLRSTVAEALHDIAMLSGKARFSARGIEAKERVHWLRCWHRVIRALPRLVWRSAMAHRRAPAASAATPDTTGS